MKRYTVPRERVVVAFVCGLTMQWTRSHDGNPEVPRLTATTRFGEFGRI